MDGFSAIKGDSSSVTVLDRDRKLLYVYDRATKHVSKLGELLGCDENGELRLDATESSTSVHYLTEDMVTCRAELWIKKNDNHAVNGGITTMAVKSQDESSMIAVENAKGQPVATIDTTRKEVRFPRLKYDIVKRFSAMDDGCLTVERYLKRHYTPVPCDQMHKITPIMADSEALRRLRLAIMGGMYALLLHDSGALETVDLDTGDKETLVFTGGIYTGGMIRNKDNSVSYIMDQDACLKAARA